MENMFEDIEQEAAPEITAAEEWQAKVQLTRDIVAKRKRGEEISPEEKMIVYEVVTEAIKGMSNAREQAIESRLQKREQLVQSDPSISQSQSPADPSQVPPEGQPQQAGGGEYYPPMFYR